MKKSCMPEIVLVNTQIPENLGATARAMLNFNLKNLRVVSPLFELSNEKIIPLSAGADSVIKNIKKFNVFEDSVKDLNILIATTNRLRSVKKKQITFQKLNKIISNSKNKVGIIFGPEKSGLENEHLSICDYSLKINSNPKFSSLNLSHAVSIVAYEIWSGNFPKRILISNIKNKNDTQATKGELSNFLLILREHLEENGFFSVLERKKILVQKISNIFTKLELTSRDISTLLGIIKNLRKNK
jgi:tRNA/rRNA methyltransferase